MLLSFMPSLRNDDWAGEIGSSLFRLVSVAARSLGVQLGEKTEEPKGLVVPNKLGLCGMLPARRRDSRLALSG